MQSEIDLTPEEYHHTRHAMSRAAGWALVATVLAGAVALTGLTSYWKQADTRAAVDILRSRVNEMRTWTDKAAILAAEIEALEEQRNAARTAENTAAWDHLLVDLSMASGDDMRLSDIHFTALGAGPGAVATAGTLSLSGAAKDDQEVLRFLTSYQASPAVQSLDLDMSSIATGQDDVPYNLFNITGRIAPVQTGGR